MVDTFKQIRKGLKSHLSRLSDQLQIFQKSMDYSNNNIRLSLNDYRLKKACNGDGSKYTGSRRAISNQASTIILSRSYQLKNLDAQFQMLVAYQKQQVKLKVKMNDICQLCTNSLRTVEVNMINYDQNILSQMNNFKINKIIKLSLIREVIEIMQLLYLHGFNNNNNNQLSSRNRLIQNSKTVDRQGDQINHIQKLGQQTFQASQQTQFNLVQQRGQLVNTNQTLDRTKYKIAQGHRKIRTMQFRQYCRKLLLYILILLLAVGIIIVLIVKIT